MQTANQPTALVKASGNALLDVWHPKKTSRALQKITSVELAIQPTTPTLASLIRDEGHEDTRELIMAWILQLNDFVNLSKKMNDVQVELTADLILETYFMLRVSDVHLIFRRAMKGEFGELYGRLDGQQILLWFKRYFEDRCVIAEQLSHKEHLSLKQGTPLLAPEYSPVLDHLKTIVEPLPEDYMSEKEKQEKTREIHADWIVKKHKKK